MPLSSLTFLTSYRGTIRTYTNEIREKVVQRVQDMCDGISKTFEVKTTLRYDRGYPATINTPDQTEKLRKAAIKIVRLNFHEKT